MSSETYKKVRGPYEFSVKYSVLEASTEKMTALRIFLWLTLLWPVESCFKFRPSKNPNELAVVIGGRKVRLIEINCEAYF